MSSWTGAGSGVDSASSWNGVGSLGLGTALLAVNRELDSPGLGTALLAVNRDWTLGD